MEIELELLVGRKYSEVYPDRRAQAPHLERVLAPGEIHDPEIFFSVEPVAIASDLVRDTTQDFVHLGYCELACARRRSVVTHVAPALSAAPTWLPRALRTRVRSRCDTYLLAARSAGAAQACTP